MGGSLARRPAPAQTGFLQLHPRSGAADTLGETRPVEGLQKVVESVNFENFSNEWKARETYDVISNDEFIETFELAAPGKEFQLYSHNHFRRGKE